MGSSISVIIEILATVVYVAGWVYFYFDILMAGKIKPTVRAMVKVFIFSGFWPLLVLGRWLIARFFIRWYLRKIDRGGQG